MKFLLGTLLYIWVIRRRQRRHRRRRHKFVFAFFQPKHVRLGSFLDKLLSEKNYLQNEEIWRIRLSGSPWGALKWPWGNF